MAQGSKRARQARIVLLALVVLAVLAAGVIWVFRGLGRWLVVEDSLEPARAIVVLSGRMPVRAQEAARLYREGLAPQVWVMRPDSPAEELGEMGIDYVGEAFYNAKVLIARGVPADAIRVFEKPAENTEKEVLQIAAELREDGGKQVILVTTKPHTRRLKTVWGRLVGERPRAIVRYASGDSFDAAHWWRNTQDALDVVREILGLANVWAGFPLRYTRR